MNPVSENKTKETFLSPTCIGTFVGLIVPECVGHFCPLYSSVNLYVYLYAFPDFDSHGFTVSFESV